MVLKKKKKGRCLVKGKKVLNEVVEKEGGYLVNQMEKVVCSQLWLLKMAIY